MPSRLIKALWNISKTKNSISSSRMMVTWSFIKLVEILLGHLILLVVP
jgi:hypothetical protein